MTDIKKMALGSHGYGLKSIYIDFKVTSKMKHEV